MPAARVWTVLAKSYGSVAAFVQASVTAEQLCLSDFMVLEALLHKGALPISALGRKVLLANASMTSAIDRLERRGYVLRENVPGDRRLRRVDLTPDGRAFIEVIYQRHAHDLEQLMQDLSQDERVLLHAALKKLGFAAEVAAQVQQRNTPVKQDR
jgi:MarR family 2-MHQ and catechol resistance regulon transcriptional repressor